MKKEEVMFRKALSRRQFLERSMVGGLAAGFAADSTRPTVRAWNRKSFAESITRAFCFGP
jgi:hypothetical protein